MIVSTGVDIIEVYRIAEAITRTPRFAERVFTEAERDYCNSRGRAAMQSFAGRFAAKEAFLKALRTGWRGKIGWHDMEVISGDLGEPAFVIVGEAKRLLDQRGAGSVHLSISHTETHAMAFVVIEGKTT